MNRSSLLLCLATMLIGIGILTMFTRNDTVRAADPTKTEWEYKVVDENDVAQASNPKLEYPDSKHCSAQTRGLNKLGSEGWEVVGTHSSDKSLHRYILKRAKR